MVRYIAENDDDSPTVYDPPLKAYLTLVVDGRISHSFPLHGEVKLGRDSHNAVVVADQKVSRHHATLAQVEKNFIITDQGSANGTYVNGVQIVQPTRLKDKDKVNLGDTTFIFTYTQPNPDELNRIVAQSAGGSAAASGSNNRTMWTLVSCMILFILILLFLIAILLGFFIGTQQPTGFLLIQFIIF